MIVEDLSLNPRTAVFESENGERSMQPREPYFLTNPYVELFNQPRIQHLKLAESKMFETQLVCGVMVTFAMLQVELELDLKSLKPEISSPSHG